LHFGHFGFTSDNMTYMRHRGQPTSIIDWAASKFLGVYTVDSSGSDETHEPSTDISDEEEEEEEEVETFGDWSAGVFPLGGDKLSSNSSFGLSSLRLMFENKTTTLNLRVFFPKIF
jgi:hypothetical protein